MLCGDATSAEAVARLLGDRKPRLMVTDPPYGIELDSEWRDRAGLNGLGPAEPSYMKKRTAGHTETSISGDTRADWSEAFELVPASRSPTSGTQVNSRAKFSMACCALGSSTISRLSGIRAERSHANPILVSSMNLAGSCEKKTLLGTARPARTRPFGTRRRRNSSWASSDEDKYDHPTQKPIELMRKPILNHLRRGELVYDPFLGSGTTLAAAELTERVCFGLELDPKYVDVVVQRWQQLTGKQATLDGDGRTFDEVAAERREVAK